MEFRKMRDEKEIEESFQQDWFKGKGQNQILEVLLDIRELLIEERDYRRTTKIKG